MLKQEVVRVGIWLIWISNSKLVLFFWASRRECDPCFAWTPLNILADGSQPSSGPCTLCRRLGGRPWSAGEHLWEEHMDEFVWIRVVTPDWEYTERLAQ
jgi:hypothetical protein